MVENKCRTEFSSIVRPQYVKSYGTYLQGYISETWISIPLALKLFNQSHYRFGFSYLYLHAFNRTCGIDMLWIEEPTLLVTRFEYANLFHTVTDWYSAYVSSRVTSLPNRPHLVFVDGHCSISRKSRTVFVASLMQPSFTGIFSDGRGFCSVYIYKLTPLEETWKALFSSLRYAKSYTGPVCFRHAILSPLGYETALFKGLTEDIYYYLAHPRHGGKVESRLSNEPEVFQSLKSWASNYEGCKINLVNGLLAHMSLKEKVQAIQDASVINGAHGAGLTHIVSASPNIVILEIISSQCRRSHFQLIARWKGLEYHAIKLDGSYANPGVVIDELSSIMKSLGC
ncbi:hypothetical protein K1719_043353 [Acacia pycnantha]|nr:hypothetical protein K1719_043353 [Acacia pycnantha]